MVTMQLPCTNSSALPTPVLSSIFHLAVQQHHPNTHFLLKKERDRDGICILRVLPWIFVRPKDSILTHLPPTIDDGKCRIGMALTDSLDELITSGAITPQLAMKVLQQVKNKKDVSHLTELFFFLPFTANWKDCHSFLGKFPYLKGYLIFHKPVLPFHSFFFFFLPFALHIY